MIPQKKTLTVGYLDILHTPQFSCRRTRVLEKNPEIGRRWYQGGDKSLIEHAYSILFPREQYFEAHPDWYCMHGGVRDPYNNRSIHLESWQMCYSNPELAQATADKVIAFFDAHPDYASYSLAANDGMYEGFCECEECQKWGMPGEVMMEFVNRVARLTAAKYPDKTLYFFVYFPTFDPPQPLHSGRAQRAAHVLQGILHCITRWTRGQIAGIMRITSSSFAIPSTPVPGGRPWRNGWK